MADSLGRVIVKLDPETIKQIGYLQAEGKTKNTTAFVREAVAEKLSEVGSNPGLEEILSIYNALNERGREWLIQCARIARESELTNPTPKRKRAEKE